MTPATDVSAAATAPSIFAEITESAGLRFQHDPGVDGSYYMPQIMGAGGAMLDYDGDGDLDLYLINGAHRERGAAAPPANRLFRHEPDGTFLDVTASSGLGDTGFGMGVAVGDVDNDGDLDVYVTNYGPDAFYRNNGDGTFTNDTLGAGLGNAGWACSASFLDYDLDGFLDLYVANYVHYPEPRVCVNDAGRPEFCGPSASPPVADVLYRNNGDGTFTDVSAPSGIGAVAGRGLGVLCADFDGDDRTDIYVANDGEANFLWINAGDGTFTESATMLGAALNLMANTEASMGVTAGDLDDDGDLDLFMTHLVRETNTLYRNDGTGSFDDVTARSGLAGPSLRYTGFGTAFFDYDNDGRLDLAVVNGRVNWQALIDGVDPDAPLAGYAEPNQLFRHEGAMRFADSSRLADPLAEPVEVSRGLVVGDLDDDGGLDLLITNCDGPARLYRNALADRGHWLIVRAVDPALHRDAYGARISVTAGGRTQHRMINPGYSYASSADPRAHFGLGEAERVEQIEIRWPGGGTQQFGPLAADQVLTLRRRTDPDPGD
ncbi:MAG: CRTAC1 family protein [Planctomycetota bacterium]